MKKYIPFCLLALAAVFWAVPALRSTYVETDTSSFYNADLMFRDSMNDITFSDNGEGRLNQKGEELDEGTFLETYKELHDARWSFFLPNNLTVVTLSEPLYYYNSPEDAEPALVLEAGKRYLVYSPELEREIFRRGGRWIGYGLVSWPTYEKGWRYARPLIPMEKYEALLDGTYELPEAFYTGLGDLKRVAYSSAMEVFLPATSEEREENGGDATGRWHDLACFHSEAVYHTDLVLADIGAYKSPDFVYPPLNLRHRLHSFDVWDGICVGLGTISFAAGFLLFLQVYLRKWLAGQLCR